MPLPRHPQMRCFGFVLVLWLGAISIEEVQAQPATRIESLRQRVAAQPAERLLVPVEERAASATDLQHAGDTARAVSEVAGVAAQPSPTGPSDSVLTESAAAVEPATRLKAGLYKVDLAKADEKVAVEAVQLHLGPQAPAVTAFAGVIRDVSPEQKVLDLKSYALTGGPLKFDKGEFVGYLKIGVTTLGLPGRHKLSAPLTFQVLEQDIATPDQVSLVETSPPYSTIRIATKEASEPFSVRVASEFQPEGITVNFRVSPTLFVSSDRRAIQGYGLETTRLLVSVLGMPNPEGRMVSIEADPSAHLAESLLRLDASGNAQTSLRSDGTGRATITASTPGLANASTQVNFMLPLRTLFASIIGGLIGGLVRVTPLFLRSRRVGRTLGSLLVAVLVGVIVFGLAVLGVNVLPVTFGVRVGEVFVFIVSALGAYVGTAALKTFVAPGD